jgi:hypothetical protein
MTVLALGKLWINRLDNGLGVSAQTGRGTRTQEFTTATNVRTYASGRRRAITTLGEQGEIGFELILLSQATKDLLRSWAGSAVQVRDHRGQKWFGVYASLAVGEYTPAGLYSATLTLMTTTVTEGV